MTIFDEVAQAIIHKAVKAMSAASNAADISFKTQVFSQIGFQRNVTLSKIKRNLIEEGLLSRVTVPTDRINDSERREQLEGMIRHCKTQTLSAAAQHGLARGDTEDALDALIILLQTIFDKLDSLHLLNTPHDKDPLNSTRYHMALYFALKLDAKRYISSLDPSLAKGLELAVEEEKLVTNSLADCTALIKKMDEDKMQLAQFLDPQHPKTEDLEYQERRRISILLFISKLQQETRDLYQKYSTWLDLFNPIDNILTKCLEKAVEEIKNPDAPHLMLSTQTSNPLPADIEPEPLAPSIPQQLTLDEPKHEVRTASPELTETSTQRMLSKLASPLPVTETPAIPPKLPEPVNVVVVQPMPLTKKQKASKQAVRFEEGAAASLGMNP